MSSDVLAAMLAALDETKDPPLTGADANNPTKPIAVRAERRTRRTYRDPTGEDAIGNIHKQQKQEKKP